MNMLPSLNGLRAISVIIVVLFHLLRFNFYVLQDIAQRIPLLDGRFGVNVFFVISGFLITYLLLKEEEVSGKISIWSFYLRRVLRIFPAYFFLLFVYLILQLTGVITISGDAWLTALTYTKYANYKVEFYTSHAWSLSIEENFYLFWALIFVIGGKVRKIFVISLILIVPLIRLFVYFYPISWASEQSLFTRIDSIATGCFVAFYRKILLEKLALHWSRFFYGSVLLLFFVPWISLLVADTNLNFLFISLGELTGTTANVAIAVIMLYSVYGPKKSWYKLLNSRAFNYIGILSYSIYLWQQLFVYKRNWWVTHFPQNIFCIALLALFSYYVIERPFLRLKSKSSMKQNCRKRTLATFTDV